jgi:MFS family permease
MVFSIILISAGFLFRPLISNLYHWYLLNALVYAGFPGATVLPSGKLVAAWFPSIRGRMMGAVTAGNNFGGITMPPLAAIIIANLNWQSAYIVFAIVMAILAIFAYFIVTEDPDIIRHEMKKTGKNISSNMDSIKSGTTLKQSIYSKNFWLIMFALTAATFTYQGVLTQLRQHFEENGFTSVAATTGLTTIAFMGIGSKLFFGRISEKITAKYATIISVALQIIGVCLFAMTDDTTIMWVGIFVFGSGFGGLGALIVLLVQETFGLIEFASIMGIMQLAMVISSTGGPIIAGMAHDNTGSFDLAFILIAIIFFMGLVTLILVKGKNFTET